MSESFRASGSALYLETPREP